MLVWGLARRGGAGRWLRYPRPTYTPTYTYTYTPWSCGKGVPSPASGGRNYLHTLTLSSTFTWSRRRRWREVEALLSLPHCHYSESVEVGDDEVEELLLVRGSGLNTRRSRFRSREKEVNVGEAVIQELQDQYQLPQEAALRMVRSENFLLVSDTAILHTIHCLRDHRVGPEQLQRIPWLLLQSAEALHNKFQQVCSKPHLFRSLSDGLGFCWFSLSDMAKYQRAFAREAASFPSHPNRVYYLADRLQVPVAVVTEKIVRPKQMLRMDINKINYLLQVFQKYGVVMQDVVADMWVFYHNVQVAEERLRQAVAAGCTHPKPWICHSSPAVFERYIERVKCKTQVLGDGGSLATYLSQRLECPLYEVEAAFRRNPGLGVTHVSHIKTKLDLLLGEGFTKQDVRSCMRVLQYREDRTRQRITEMKSLGEFPFPISVLHKRAKTYFNIVQRVKRARREGQERGRRGEVVMEGKNGKEQEGE